MHALATKARIALELKHYQVVEDMIRQIMGIDRSLGIADIKPERDFFDRLPPGAIDPELARQYDQYTANRKKPRDER